MIVSRSSAFIATPLGLVSPCFPLPWETMAPEGICLFISWGGPCTRAGNQKDRERGERFPSSSYEQETAPKALIKSLPSSPESHPMLFPKPFTCEEWSNQMAIPELEMGPASPVQWPRGVCLCSSRVL